ncbi:MAG: tetratricopeptide repeat protein [Desulfobacterales bacterium]|nr:tetratricopeptide repeat protein [Desulfobacterales bacterium]
MDSEKLASRAELLFENGKKKHEQGQEEEALVLFNQALDIYRQILDKDGEMAALNHLAVVYRTINNFEKSVEIYATLLQLFEDVNDVEAQGRVLNNIGLIRARDGSYENALKNFHRALALFRSIGNDNGVAEQLGNIGAVYRDLKEYDKALDGCHDALKVYQKTRLAPFDIKVDGRMDQLLDIFGRVGVLFRFMSGF